MFLSSAMLFLPAAISYVALQWYPELAYDLVGEGFLDFSPTDEAHLHQIPSLFQPVAASAIVRIGISTAFLSCCAPSGPSQGPPLPQPTV